MSEEALLSVDAPGVLGNDSDADGDALTAQVVSEPTKGTLTLSANGSFTYQPNTNAVGEDNFTYRANDGTGGSSDATVTITITNENDAPVAGNDTYTTGEETLLSVEAPAVLGNDSDVDGDVLTAQVVSEPTKGTLTLSANGSFTYQPNTNAIGADSFTYRANDGTAGSNDATVTITITNENDAPVAGDNGYTTGEDAPLSVPAPGVLDNDSDADGDVLTAQQASGPTKGTLTLNANGSFNYQPNTNAIGQDTFTYRASDGTVASNVATVTITIGSANDAPVARNDSYTTNEDTQLTVAAAQGVLDNDSDADGDALTAEVVSGPTKGTLTLNANGSFTYTPNANATGGDSFTYRANDGTTNSNVATVAITIGDLNDPPTISDIGNQTVDEDGSTGAIPFMISDPETPAGSLSLLRSSSNQILVPDGNIVFGGLGANRTVTVTPSAGQSGAATITVTVSDGSRTDNDSFVLTVTSVNDPPTISDIPNRTIDEDDSTGPINFTVGDAETPAGSLTLSRTSSNQALVPLSGITFGGSGASRTVTVTPAAGQSGTVTITVTVSDGSKSDNDSFVLTVNPINDQPTARDDLVTTPEDTPVTINVRSNDDDPDEDVLTVTAVTQPANGSVVINGGGANLTYSPGVNFNGTNTFNYTVSDGRGGNDAATVTVTVTPVNDRPNAVDDAATTPENTPVTIPVRTNDTDPETPNSALTVSSISQPSNGSAAIAGGGSSITFTPNANFNGTTTFQYTISDGSGGTDQATVTVRVSSINTAPPDASIDSPGAGLTSIQIGQTVSFAGSATDPDGTIVSYAWDFGGGAPNSSVQDPGDVQFSSVGLFTVTFNVTDNEGAVDPTPPTRQVQVNQAPPRQNQPPNTIIDSPAGNVTVQLGQSVAFAGTATDADGTITGFAWTFPGGTPESSVLQDPGNVIYNTPGVYTATFNATDENGASDLSPATRTISVVTPGGTNLPPEAAITLPVGNTTVPVGGSLVFEGDALDPDGTITAFFWDFGGGAPNVSVEDPGSVTFTTAGTYLVTFNVTDNAGASDPTPSVRTIVVGGGGGGVNVERFNVDVQSPGSAERVDGHDVLFVLRSIATQDLRADVSGDGVVNQIDVQLVFAALGEVGE